jgi:photosystem II stability/assembly factor-like uncharacterized protein
VSNSWASEAWGRHGALNRAVARASLAALLLAGVAGPAWAQSARRRGAHAAAKAAAQAKDTAQATSPIVPSGQIVYDTALYQGMRYHMVGPTRGGRVDAVAGVRGQPLTFYMGATGGGVWKTTDAGKTWKNVSDDYFDAGSIGAIGVSDSDPNVVYVGTGEAEVRGNASAGRGMFRSDDAGRTWHFVGLRDAGQIGRVVVDPRDADRVYVAALGHAFGPNAMRGVFRSTDGGKTWDKVLFVSDSTGAIDIAMDPSNPRILYASMWRAERRPWTMIDGAHEGGVYKSTDGGDTWKKLTGLPDDLIGKSSVAVSPADPDRVWVLMVAGSHAGTIDEGGLYRSDDAGKSWTRLNHNHKLLQRGWYYIHVTADPRDENTVYVMNTAPYRSIDGGHTFQPMHPPHGDTHRLWIDPDDPQTMIIGDDGGAQITQDGGASWSTVLNQPTAQFYRVNVDDGWPYRLSGGQQDNSSISVPAWSQGGRLTPGADWFTMGGCESGYTAVDPRNPDIVYGGCYDGELDRVDLSTGQSRNIVPYPQLTDGQALRDIKYRFQWNAPFLISEHDPNVLYYASQYVMRSTDEGQTWTEISPDLTRHTASEQGYPGGPIQHDISGVETWATVFALAESPRDSLTLWAGSDDGLVHITRDGGAHWADITPPGLPHEATINVIAPSPETPGKAYLTAYDYRRDDFAPYVYRTTDFGAHWTRIADGTHGIPGDDPVRAVREDPTRPGLLYAGTEFGMYVSFDDGAHWQTLQLNLPVVPVTDVTVHGSDLAVATQGRSYWILGDLTPLRQLGDSVAKADHWLYQPRDAYRTEVRGPGGPPAPRDAVFDYYFRTKPKGDVTLEILDSAGHVVQSITSDSAKARTENLTLEGIQGGARPHKLVVPTGAGMHRFVWDLRYRQPDLVPDAVMYSGYAGGATAAPGTYSVRVSVDGWSQSRSFQVRIDPRLKGVTNQDLLAQFDLESRTLAMLDSLHDALRQLRSARQQLEQATSRAADVLGSGSGSGADSAAMAPIRASAKALEDSLTAMEDTLLQTKSSSGQDPINFQSMLNNQIAYLANALNGVEAKPTAGDEQRFRDLSEQWTAQRQRLDRMLGPGVAAFNALLDAHHVPPVVAPSGAPPEPGTGSKSGSGG